MLKEKLLLILSGCATAISGTFYLHWFGFEESPFRVRVPHYSGPSWKKPTNVIRAEFMNELLKLIDWLILIGIVIIIILIVLKVVKALVVPLFQRKTTSNNVDSHEELTDE